MTDTFGVFGAVFCDFGDAFTVYDTNGEEPLSAMVSSISQEEEGLVTVLDEGRHGLEDGDFVTFTEVKGMAELNGCEPKQVKVKGRTRSRSTTRAAAASTSAAGTCTR